MSKNPFVSVLMTSYNREKYIAAAIESVLASTFQDFELLIIDDGSKDKTLEIARSYQADSRVKVHLNPQNLGDYPNRNRAAELAKGKYLKYVDADDLIYPHGLEIMVESMEKFPQAGFGLAVPQTNERPYPFCLSPHEAYKSHFFGAGVFGRAPLSAIIRSDAFQEMGGFSRVEGPRGDIEMWLRIGARYPVVLMVNGLVWWRAHDEQETQYRKNVLAEDMSRSYLLVLKALRDSNCPLETKEREQAIHQRKRMHARRILRLFARSPRTARAILHHSGMKPQELKRAFGGT